jgi:hypothetical protein
MNGDDLVKQDKAVTKRDKEGVWIVRVGTWLCAFLMTWLIVPWKKKVKEKADE